MTLPFRSSHEPCSAMARHRHRQGYIALVLEGGLIEAGMRPRIEAAAGDVVIHPDFSCHSDRFGRRGARVLNLPMLNHGAYRAGRIRDVDQIVRLAEKDPNAAILACLEQFIEVPRTARDWPDQLASSLVGNPGLSISRWAVDEQLCPASVSRGFRRAYGVSPKRFRLEAKVAEALRSLRSGQATGAGAALECGFADHAHMCRSILAVTGLTPMALQGKSVQYLNQASC